MSMTYANANTEARAEDTTFVPRYARTTKSKKSVKTWMILAPIGAVVLLGSGVAMMMGGEQAAPVQPAETAAPAMQPPPRRDDGRPGAGHPRPGRSRAHAGCDPDARRCACAGRSPRRTRHPSRCARCRTARRRPC